jgi:hypothetical protein
MPLEEKPDDIESVSTEELFARHDEACRREGESFAPKFSLDGRGRLIPDAAVTSERKRLEVEIQRRAKLHDPEVLERARKALRKGSHRSGQDFYIESSTGSPRSEESSPERPYRQWATERLRRKYDQLGKKLQALDERIPHWRTLQGGLGNEPSPAYVQGREWETEREEIALELSRRGEIEDKPDADGSSGSSLLADEPVQRSEKRRSNSNPRETFVQPILDKNGFSIHDWAKTAKVDFHTASSYLKGETNPYKSTRKKLADALRIKVEELPK